MRLNEEEENHLRASASAFRLCFVGTKATNWAAGASPKKSRNDVYIITIGWKTFKNPTYPPNKLSRYRPEIFISFCFSLKRQIPKTHLTASKNHSVCLPCIQSRRSRNYSRNQSRNHTQPKSRFTKNAFSLYG